MTVVSIVFAAMAVILGWNLDNAEKTGPRRGTVSPAPTNLTHHYKNCTEAWADGRTDIPRGDPDYHPALDRDGDGWACDRSDPAG